MTTINNNFLFSSIYRISEDFELFWRFSDLSGFFFVYLEKKRWIFFLDSTFKCKFVTRPSSLKIKSIKIPKIQMSWAIFSQVWLRYTLTFWFLQYIEFLKILSFFGIFLIYPVFFCRLRKQWWIFFMVSTFKWEFLTKSRSLKIKFIKIPKSQMSWAFFSQVWLRYTPTFWFLQYVEFLKILSYFGFFLIYPDFFL